MMFFFVETTPVLMSRFIDHQGILEEAKKPTHT
jgi:hypothetical protein